jgi:hypothetical protein
MKEKLLQALKTKYSNLGFSEKTMEQVSEYLGQTVTEDTGIEPAINGAELLLKAFQGDIDKRVTEAVTKVKGEQRKAEPSTQTQQKDRDQQDEVPSWAKGILQRLDAFEAKESQAKLTGILRQKLAEKVPESFLRGRTITINSEADIDKLATEIEADFTATKQEMINQGVFVELPKKPQTPGQEGVEIAKRIAEQRNRGMAEGIEGKKI